MKKTKRARPWTRDDSNPDTNVLLVFRELQKRQLADLETCRRVWQHEQDPAAVLEALRRVELPEWLLSAVVVLTTESADGLPQIKAKLWNNHKSSVEERERAFQFAGARTQMQLTRQEAALLAGRLTSRQRGLPELTKNGIEKVFVKVAKNLKAHPFRYYVPKPGLKKFIEDAWSRTLAAWRAAIS